MDDFIDKVAWGLNIVFSNGFGYPRARWLVFGRRPGRAGVQGLPAPAPGPDAGVVLGVRRLTRAEHRQQRADPRRAPRRRWTRRRAGAGCRRCEPRPSSCTTSRGWSRAATGTCRRRASCSVGIDDAAAARRWLGTVAAAVTRADERPQRRAVNVALTSSGLERLGLTRRRVAPVLERVRRRDDHRRTAAGSSATSATTRRSTGTGAARARRRSTRCSSSTPRTTRAWTRSSRSTQRLDGVVVVSGSARPTCDEHEPFGFRDGISQPLDRGALAKKGPPETTSAPASSCSATRTSTAATRTGRSSARSAACCRATGRLAGRPRPQRQLPRLPPAAPGRPRLLELPRPGDEAARRRAPIPTAGSGSRPRWSGAGRAARRLLLAPDDDDPSLAERERLRVPRARPHGRALPGRRAHPAREPARLARPEAGHREVVRDQPAPPDPAARPRVRIGR